MKTPVVLLLLSLAAAKASIYDDYIALLPNASWAHPIPYKSQLAANEKNDDTCTAFYSCKDCQTAQVCKPTSNNGIMELVSTITCPSDRPYCDPKSGTCVVDAPEECGKREDDFICMGNGRFPDKDCTKFHVCINLVPTFFTCSVPGQKYNPVSQTCEFSETCGTFDCSPANAGSKAAHSSHERYFAYCNSAANGLLVVDACPPMFRLDHESQSCVPDCKTDGIIPDPSDCHFYYKCSQLTVNKGIKFMTSNRLQCPEKMAYSLSDFLCVEEEKVESCKKKTA